MPEIQQHFVSLRDSGVHLYPCQVPGLGVLSSSALPACSCCCIKLSPCLPWAGCQANNPCCLEASFEKFPFFHGQRHTICGPVASPWQLLSDLLKQGDCVNHMKKAQMVFCALKASIERTTDTQAVFSLWEIGYTTLLPLLWGDVCAWGHRNCCVTAVRV